MNAALGAGILNFPAAFDTAGGILVATIMHLLLLVLAAASLFTLGWCSDVRGTGNYQDTVAALCGKWGRRSCSIVVAFYCYFTCITFLVVVGDQSDTIFHDIFGVSFCDH
uniref:Amino acid transporter transmembrane domain-containing protein n=1 Tax=Plectus sambesii TaxID=2011161 RepID=A0A914VRD3_9BILA